MPRMSLNQVTTYRWTFDEDVLHYREAGIEAIGVWRRKIVAFGEERGAELIREAGLTVSAVVGGGGFTGGDGRSYRDAVEDAIEGVALAGELGAGVFVLVSGPRGGHTTNHARGLIVGALRELVPVARAHGVALGLEPAHPAMSRAWNCLGCIDEALRVLDGVGDERAGLVFDSYHLWREPRLPDRIAEIAPRTKLVQLSDWREPTSDHDRLVPGSGVCGLPALAQAFDAAGYEGFYDVEILSDELWAADYGGLVRDCCAGFRGLWGSLG